jgi:GR25 family glycosyltransferase involved in LPS biosynthesis
MSVLDKFCYKIFHIPGYGDSGPIRQSLFDDLDPYLSSKISRIDTPTILISSENDYFDVQDKYNILDPKTKFKWGELGIWASNLVAMKNFLESDKEYLMLMEDDIYVKDKELFLSLLENFMGQLPEGWEIFSYFVHPKEYWLGYGVEVDDSIPGFPVYQVSDPKDVSFDADVVEAYQDWSLLCYIVNKDSAKRILDIIKEIGITEPIDWFVFNKFNKLFKTYTISPVAIPGCELYETTSQFQQTEMPMTIPEKRTEMARADSERIPNWFQMGSTKETFTELLSEYVGKDDLRFLEIGSFCGDSSAWIANNVLTGNNSRLDCIDPWLLDVENLSYDWSEIEQEFDKQMKPYKDRITKNKCFSFDWLISNRNNKFDFIYIDGDHSAKAILEDAVLSWNILKINGIMAFDDYEWRHPDGQEYDPKKAIDAFLDIYRSKISVMHMGWQVWIRKLAD